MNNRSQQILGVDFDNTIASYGEVLHRLAVRWGLITNDVKKDKSEIRDLVRQLPGGEIEWQKLQGAIYGPEIRGARPMDGVQSFFKTCKQNGTQVFIVSHKTEYAGYDDTGTNLRSAAMAWMKQHRFFEADDLGLCAENVYFEATRHKKLQRIKDLGCTYFIDDLEETFLEHLLPEDVVKILYAPDEATTSPEGVLEGVTVARSWQEITDRVFNGSS